MKIKADFVTNSSSTAFIVFWPHSIKTLEDVSKYVKRKDFADVIFRDAAKQKPIIVDKGSKTIMQKFINELSEGYLTDDDYHFDDGNPESFCKENGITEKELFDTNIWYIQLLMERELKRDQHYLSVALDLLLKYEGKYAYFFEYGDEGAELYYELETHNDWGGLPYVRISKH